MYKKLSILCLIFIFFVTKGYCQTAAYKENSKLLTSLKFYLSQEGVVIFPLLLDNYTDSLYFIFDTGSSATFLDSATAVSLGMKFPKQQRKARGMGGYQEIYLSPDHQLHIQSLTEDNIDIYFMNIEILSFLYGRKIHGIIGYPLLQKYITKIDYDKNEISFWTFGKTKFPKRGFYVRPNIQTFPYYIGEIEDLRRTPFSYMFDSGAALTLLLSNAYVSERNFLSPERIIFKKKLRGLGGEIDFDISVTKKFRFGKYTFQNVPINMFEDENNIFSYPKNGGLVGNEILRRFNSVFDYNARLFHFIPNKHFKDPFDYAYSGLEIYFIDEKVIIGDISDSSPAQEAGLKEGDEIISINKHFAMDINKAKKELQSTIGRVKIIIKRGDELIETEMRPIDMRKKTRKYKKLFSKP